jgi:hypothetical protein
VETMFQGRKRKNIAKFAAAVVWACALVNPDSAVAGAELQIDRLRLIPSLEVQESYNSNLFLSPENEQPVWITSILPRLQLVYPLEYYYLEIDASSETLLHSDHTEENSTNLRLDGGAGADFPGGFGFRLGGEYRKERLTTSVELGEGEDRTESRIDVTISYDVKDMVRLKAEWGSSEIAYDLTDDRDRGENTFTGDIYYRFRPKTAALLEVVYTDFAYDVEDEKDNRSTAVLGGLLWKVTDKSIGTVKVGSEWKEYGDSSKEDGAFPVASARLEHLFTPFTTGFLTVSRASEESNFSENPYFISNQIDVRLRNQVTPYVYVLGLLGYRLDDYPNEISWNEGYVEREDGVLTAGLTATIDLLRLVALEGGYDYSRRDSNLDYLDYTVHEVSLTLRYPPDGSGEGKSR